MTMMKRIVDETTCLSCLSITNCNYMDCNEVKFTVIFSER